MFKIFRNGFSLAEMMIVMLILTLVLAAATPIVTKRATVDNDNGSTPAGVINSYAGSTIPNGWLLCDGSSYSTSGIYSKLFNSIKYSYGGSGSSFNVPDLRGQFIRGLDQRDAGYTDNYFTDTGNKRTLGSPQTDSIQNIVGKIDASASPTYCQAFGETFDQYTTISGPFKGIYAVTDETAADNVAQSHIIGFSFDASRVVRTSTETRPKNIALNYIIKY